MNRKEYYEQRNKLRSMRSAFFSGWIEKKINDHYAHELLNLIEGEFDGCLIDSIKPETSYALNINQYRHFIWANSRGTRPMNVKKAGLK